MPDTVLRPLLLLLAHLFLTADFEVGINIIPLL